MTQGTSCVSFLKGLGYSRTGFVRWTLSPEERCPSFHTDLHFDTSPSTNGYVYMTGWSQGGKGAVRGDDLVFCNLT